MGITLLSNRLQIIVRHNDDSHSYYTIDPRKGWKIVPSQQCLIIGKGLDRKYIPLINVKDFVLDEVPMADEALSSPDPRG